jgi:hypothetical protein
MSAVVAAGLTQPPSAVTLAGATLREDEGAEIIKKFTASCPLKVLSRKLRQRKIHTGKNRKRA